MPLDKLFASESPAVAVRAVHLDLKGTPPTPRRLVELLDLFAALRYNAVLVEWEDTFPWTVDTRFRCETAYTPEQVDAFTARAAQLGIEVIPLVQCLGHMETPLSVPGYEHLREVPDQANVLNPLADGAGELIRDMVLDVLDRTPDARHFHLGGDEAWSFGTHPDTGAYIEKHGKGALYLKHVGPLLDLLNERGIRPILWHDMMRDWDADALTDLAARADLCVWGYNGRPDETTGHHSTEIMQRFADHGVTMWGGTAYKGATRPNSDLPNLDIHVVNAKGYVDVADRFDFAGVIATAWSRFWTHSGHCETIEASLDSLVNVGAILHEGDPPAGGRDDCLAALDELGEKDRFVAARAEMENLAGCRQWFWEHLSAAMEHLTAATLDSRRRDGRTAELGRSVANIPDKIRKCHEEINRLWDGLIPRIWIDRYFAERVAPMRELIDQINLRGRTLAAGTGMGDLPCSQ